MKSVVLIIHGKPIIAKAKIGQHFNVHTTPAPHGWGQEDSKYVSIADDGEVKFDHEARDRAHQSVTERIKKGFFSGKSSS